MFFCKKKSQSLLHKQMVEKHESMENDIQPYEKVKPGWQVAYDQRLRKIASVAEGSWEELAPILGKLTIQVPQYGFTS